MESLQSCGNVDKKKQVYFAFRHCIKDTQPDRFYHKIMLYTVSKTYCHTNVL